MWEVTIPDFQMFMKVAFHHLPESTAMANINSWA